MFIHERQRKRERERERRRDRQREKQAPCKEPDAGPNPGTPESHPGMKAGAKLLSHSGIPMESEILTVLLRLDNAEQVYQENNGNPNYALAGLDRKLALLLLF